MMLRGLVLVIRLNQHPYQSNNPLNNHLSQPNQHHRRRRHHHYQHHTTIISDINASKTLPGSHKV